MGKGAMSNENQGEGKDCEAENMAAWLVGVNTLKIQPFKLPPLGIYSLTCLSKSIFSLDENIRFSI